ncbi:hypothetical protein ACQKFK_21540 [Bacillus mycoides]|uniref:hypothetical protein n=1 Tax=Bacillus mycoides TaxID=1405 RepID=UPI003D0042BE
MKKQIGMIVSAFTCVSIFLSGCGTKKQQNPENRNGTNEKGCKGIGLELVITGRER